MARRVPGVTPFFARASRSTNGPMSESETGAVVRPLFNQYSFTSRRVEPDFTKSSQGWSFSGGRAAASCRFLEVRRDETLRLRNPLQLAVRTPIVGSNFSTVSVRIVAPFQSG